MLDGNPFPAFGPADRVKIVLLPGASTVAKRHVAALADSPHLVPGDSLAATLCGHTYDPSRIPAPEFTERNGCLKCARILAARQAQRLAGLGEQITPDGRRVRVAPEIVADASALAPAAQARLQGPPSSITGVFTPTAPETAETPNNPTITIDWVRFSLPATPDALDIARRLLDAGGGWTEENTGRWHYKRRLRRGDVAIYFDGNGGTVCCDITGAGCRQLEAEGVIECPEGMAALGLVGGWSAWLGEVVTVCKRITRLDVAWDDRNGLLSLPEVLASVRSGCCVTRFGEVRPHWSLDPATGAEILEGIVFGSRQSLMFVRMYNKQHEQIVKTGEDPGQWIRLEAECKDEKATAWAHLLARASLSSLASDLYASLDFKERNDNDPTHRYRWPTADWWAAFLSRAEKARVKLDPKIRDLATAAGNLARQWGPTLAAIVHMPDLGAKWLQSVARAGMARWRPEHIDAMARHLAGVAPDMETPRPLDDSPMVDPCVSCGEPLHRLNRSRDPETCFWCWLNPLPVPGPSTT